MNKIAVSIFTLFTLISLAACSSNYPQESSSPISETPEASPEQELVVEKSNVEDSNTSDEATAVHKDIVLEDLEIKISFPEGYKLRESKGYRDEIAIYYLRDESESEMQMPVDVRISDEETVTEFVKNSDSDIFCLDHGMCDEGFDPNQFITLFNNQKSMTVGDGSQQPINSPFFSGFFSSPFDDKNDELKIFNNRKYIISNSSFVPSGEVWRKYTTFVNDVRVQMDVIWALDRTMDHNENLHQYDREADKLIESFIIELL